MLDFIRIIGIEEIIEALSLAKRLVYLDALKRVVVPVGLEIMNETLDDSSAVEEGDVPPGHPGLVLFIY